MEKKDLKELIYNIKEQCLDIIESYENTMKPKNWQLPDFNLDKERQLKLEGMAFFAEKINQLIEDTYSIKREEKLFAGHCQLSDARMQEE